ncbi:MAG: phage terminase large subunit family protein [Thermoanaerobaculia bacterium]|nr:phage terminase large subunit family protein [Thermoanaerobaculia bacterium]
MQDAEELLDDDPFDFEGKGEVRPEMIRDINWNAAYQWAPALKELAAKTPGGSPTFHGRRSDIAQAILHHLGKPLRLDNHAFLLPIYNDQDSQLVMKCSRQVAKSSTICNLQVLEAVLRPHWRTLYVSPSHQQTRQYSNEKLRPTLYDSPLLKNVFLGKGVIDQVFEKTLLNGSYIFLRAAYLTAARARGIPASRVFFDEAQDLLKDNIKVISQSLSASLISAGVEGSEMITGTPLTHSNTLEEYWRWSTQNEWLIPCDCKGGDAGGYWNFLDERNIGKTGLICSNCGKPLDAASGQWVTFCPGEYYVGYHISQLMVPWKQGLNAWRKEIVLPFEKWPENKFHNEILGFSYDTASAPVTRMDLQKCCYPDKKLPARDTSKIIHARNSTMNGLRIFGGIDWGEGRQEGSAEKGKRKFASWTVLTLGAYVTDEIFWPFLWKRYVGKDIDPEVIVPDVLNICGHWGVEVLGADWGHGWGVNSRLFKARGRTGVMQFAYSTSLGERKRYDAEAHKFIINRNAVLADTFQAFKQQKFILPKWDEFESFGKDILAEYVEYNERARTMMYDHPIDQPDDALHSLVYCKLAADISHNRF